MFIGHYGVSFTTKSADQHIWRSPEQHFGRNKNEILFQKLERSNEDDESLWNDFGFVVVMRNFCYGF